MAFLVSVQVRILGFLLDYLDCTITLPNLQFLFRIYYYIPFRAFNSAVLNATIFFPTCSLYLHVHQIINFRSFNSKISSRMH